MSFRFASISEQTCCISFTCVEMSSRHLQWYMEAGGQAMMDVSSVVVLIIGSNWSCKC